jgi:hypothetical protein
MELSRRINLRLNAEQFADVTAYARQRGLRNSPAVRLLIAQSLHGETSRAEAPAAFAALIAAEHAVLMVASVLPEGQRRLGELGAQAAAAAEERLALVQEVGR